MENCNFVTRLTDSHCEAKGALIPSSLVNNQKGRRSSQIKLVPDRDGSVGAIDAAVDLVAGDRIELDNDTAQLYTIGRFLAVRNSYRPHRTVNQSARVLGSTGNGQGPWGQV